MTSYAPGRGPARSDTDPALRRFTDGMDRAVAATTDSAARAAAASSLLRDLLAHPEGCYSLVALVWRPGQATPIHDHRCWCVVGVLEGEEDEERFHLVEQDGRKALVLTGNERQAAGSVCTLVPPQENIHRVSSAAPTGVTVSLHVYGDDIAECGSSINQVFDQALVLPAATPADVGDLLSWRDHT